MDSSVLQIVALEIEKQINKSIVNYTLYFDNVKKEVLISINSEKEKQPVSNPLLAQGMEMYIDQLGLPENITCNYLVIFWSELGDSTMSVYMTEKNTGEKIKETTKKV